MTCPGSESMYAGRAGLPRAWNGALGLVLLTAALICQFTSITNTHIGR